jgi:predicted Zn-dependent protease with MMP-like domain
MDASEFEQILEYLDACWNDGRHGEVERASRRALDGADPDQARHLWCYVHYALRALDRRREAREAAERCGRALCRAWASFDVWDFDAAQRWVGEVEGSAEDEASAEGLLGILAEFAGKDGHPHYEEAARISPDTYSVPPVLTERQVREICLSALRSLPRSLRKALHRVPIHVFDVPPPARKEMSPLILGCASREFVELYRLNIARCAADRAEAVEEVRSTLLHEIGHVFGMDHRQLDRMGL